VDGSEWNLKITRPEDLVLGASIVEKLFPEV
jgi:2-C-methyl-D-erythritol 4-phosphate cytidylyltransferase